MSENEIQNIFSHNLKDLVQKNGCTYTELADALNIRKSTVSNWINGISLPRMDKIDKICNYFNIKRSDLLEDKTKTNEPDAKNNREKKVSYEYEQINRKKNITDNITEAFYQMYIAEEDIRKKTLKALIEILEQLNGDGMKDLLEYAISLQDDELYKSIYFNNNKMKDNFKKLKKQD